MPSEQTRRKRALGEFLATLREDAGLKPMAVADLLRKSPSTVSRIETGHTLCDYSRLTAMLGFYQATAEQREQAEELWEEARQDTAKVEHSTAMPPKYRAYLKAWDDAKLARTLQQTMLPGPLQTAAYRRRMYQAWRRFIASPADTERDESSMEQRKQRLHGSQPLEYQALLDEAVIRRPVGGPEIMAEQLRYLLTLGERPNVTIQVIPFGAGEYGVMTGAVTWLEFPDPDYPDAVYLEYPGGGEWIEKASDVRTFAGAIDDASPLALSVEESAELLRGEAESLEQGR